MSIESTWQTYLNLSRELIHLESLASLLVWDQEILMPKGAVESRAGQRVTVSALHHQKLTGHRLGDVLERLEEESLQQEQEADLREIRRKRKRALRIPEELVRDLTAAKTLAYEKWVEAKTNSDFGVFEESLQRVLDLKRAEARHLGDSESLYDPLLDEYEPGMTRRRLKELFAPVGPALTSLVDRLSSAGASPSSDSFQGERFSPAKQEAFGRRVLTRFGFDWNRGRLDQSPHPFCVGISPDDVRITTRYSEDHFTGSLFGLIHECGHALYEQGLRSIPYGRALGQAVSLGVHESQSRLWENQIARSRAFWSFWFPRLKETYPRQMKGQDLDGFLRFINRIERSPIRVESDEVTYGLHVLLRFEIEVRMIEGELQAKDLPAAWNELMKEYLGIEPRNDAEGVLQDTHWSQGLIGYFPTYLLGNLYAAQLMRQIEKDTPNLWEEIASGRYASLRDWLDQNIYSRGNSLQAVELLQFLTKEPPKAQPFLDYLEEKFGDLFGE